VSPTPPHNLPFQLTGIIGRRAEIQSARQSLLEGCTRLLTLTGIGGIGKTRLALAIAADLLPTFSDGAWFVDLSPIRDVRLVPCNITLALGLSGPGEKPGIERVEALLKTRRILLVLDNFEQVLNGAPVVARLLERCPNLQVLVTSRVPLGLHGERRLPVPLLSLPDLQKADDPQLVMKEDAVALFVERARAVDPSFTLDAHNVNAVVQLCTLLDGLPLAIELAATQMGLLSPEALAARLARHLPLPTDFAPARLERHRTLRAAFASSLELLDEVHKAIFGRLGVFSGGWDLEACTQVTDVNAFGLDALDVMANLGIHHLVRPAPGGAEVPRFVMLETIREFVLEQLRARDDGAEAARRHAEFFLGLAERAEPELRTPNMGAWLERLELDHDNFRAALAWSLDEGETDYGLRLAGALVGFWRARGYYPEGRRWLASVLAQSSSSRTATRAKALNGAAILALVQNDGGQAEIHLKDALDLWRQLGNTRRVAGALTNLAIVFKDRGAFQEARNLLEEGLGLLRALGDQSAVAIALSNLGSVVLEEGDFKKATMLLEECVALSKTVGEPLSLITARTSLGIALLQQGDLVGASAQLEESLALSVKLKDQQQMNYARHYLGLASLRQGALERAALLLHESLRWFFQAGSQRMLPWSLAAAAELAAQSGQPEPAARWLGAAAKVLSAAEHATSKEGNRVAMLADALMSRMGEQRWTIAWQWGHETSLEDAVAAALASWEKVFAPATGREDASTPNTEVGLTKREHEVLLLVVQGLPNKKVAATLGLSPRTIDAHLSSIYSKLGVSSRTAAAHVATTKKLL